jgi:2-dehydropantoate 2-reductase
VVEALRGTRCEVELSADFPTVAWRKLLQNAVAGLMVLANRRAGMFRREDISELALAYLREGLTVARAEGAKLADDVAQKILANFQRARTSARRFSLTVRRIARWSGTSATA